MIERPAVAGGGACEGGGVASSGSREIGGIKKEACGGLCGGEEGALLAEENRVWVYS